MILKTVSNMSVKSVAIAIVAAHALPILFVMYMESFLNLLLPSLFVVLIPLFFLLYKPAEGNALVSTRAAVFKLLGMALCSVMTLFLIGYFTTTFQPPIQEANHGVGWVALPGAENMAYVLRLFLQTWLFALVCMMAARWFKEVPGVSGLLSRFSATRELMPWLLDVTVISGVYMLLTVIVVLATQQLCYLLSRLLGLDELFAFPQFSLFLFLFSLFVMNKAMSFSKRLVIYAKKPHAKLAFVYLACIGFVSFVWVFSQLSMLGLPEGVQLELNQALQIGSASLESFEQRWPLLLLACSFFMVAPLSVLMSRLLASGSKFLLGMALLAPMVITAFFLTSFPSINHVFWSWVPNLHFSIVPMTDALAQFKFNGFSILLLVLLTILLSVMGSGSLFMKTLALLLPNSNGHRERRVNENIARYFRLVCLMAGVFGLLGVYGMALTVSIYLPTALTGCILLIGMALYQRTKNLREKGKDTTIYMEVK